LQLKFTCAGIKKSNYSSTIVNTSPGYMETATSSVGCVKTRFLLLSDTHAEEFPPNLKPLRHADVVIHCGDLTEESKLDEFRAAIRLLKELDAPLKLVIPGNHDFTLDIPVFKREVAKIATPVEPELVRREFGDYGEAKQLFRNAAGAGIVLLDEGIHRFKLRNGASLTVYASPMTPSLGNWGFQYRRGEGHNFDIGIGVDVVVTHGPPRGILDRSLSGSRAGCSDLFAAVCRSRPRLHCFGHIHEGWGAKLVTWREQPSESPTHFADIDNEKSILVDALAGLRPSKSDTEESLEARNGKLEKCNREGCYATSHCTGDPNPIEPGAQTLFVNAAIQGLDENLPFQFPWLVDIELPRAS
jgi:hypothetical protein